GAAAPMGNQSPAEDLLFPTTANLTATQDNAQSNFGSMIFTGSGYTIAQSGVIVTGFAGGISTSNVAGSNTSAIALNVAAAQSWNSGFAGTTFTQSGNLQGAGPLTV